MLICLDASERVRSLGLRVTVLYFKWLFRQKARGRKKWEDLRTQIKSVHIRQETLDYKYTHTRTVDKRAGSCARQQNADVWKCSASLLGAWCLDPGPIPPAETEIESGRPGDHTLLLFLFPPELVQKKKQPVDIMHQQGGGIWSTTPLLHKVFFNCIAQCFSLLCFKKIYIISPQGPEVGSGV